MKKIGDLSAEKSEVKPLNEESWPDELVFPVNLKEEVFIKHIRGPLFFGSTSYFQELVNQIPDSTSTIIIRMGRMQYIDQSGLYALEDVLVDLVKDGKKVLLVKIVNQPRYMMESIDIIPDLIPEDQIFENFKDCLAWIKEDIKSRNLKLE